MITEDYVSYETAKLLKEKGFSCDEISCIKVFKGHTYKIHGTVIDADEDVTIPTIQLAMKWLREVHNIYINIDIHWLYFANQNGFMYIITKILENGTDYVNSNGDENDEYFYSTYEEACEAAIKYCLENLI